MTKITPSSKDDNLDFFYLYHLVRFYTDVWN